MVLALLLDNKATIIPWGPRQNEAIQGENEDAGGKMTNLLLMWDCSLPTTFYFSVSSRVPISPAQANICLQQQNTRSGID